MNCEKHIIVALSSVDNGIGAAGVLPWKLPKELAYFARVTNELPHHLPSIKYINAVIMGRATWDSMGQRPLKNRINVIITSTPQLYIADSLATAECMESQKTAHIIYCQWDTHESAIVAYIAKLNAVKQQAQNEGDIIDGGSSSSSADYYMLHRVFYIGGSSIYRLALLEPITSLYITEIYAKYECDTYFPLIADDEYVTTYISAFQMEGDKKTPTYYRHIVKTHRMLLLKQQALKTWVNAEEVAYLVLMRTILGTGIRKGDRTGTGILSTFGHQLRYDLRDTFPLSTTREMFMRGVFEELMFYLRGETDNTILQTKKIHVWDGNTSRDFLDKRGLHYLPEGDMGETYGFNMRHYGAKYINCKTSYTEPLHQGYDQLAAVIELLRTDPESRRIIINLWNPATQDKAALPSCLCQYQFWVNTTTWELSLQIYIRSSDYYLANNWNTCTGALFVHLLCNTPELQHLHPGELIVTMGDTHIYSTHIAQATENSSRIPLPYPKLHVKCVKPITEFVWNDIALIGYKSLPKIAATMAV